MSTTPTHAFGLAIPFGIMWTTVAPGLTLGGGLGHLTRKCGLSIDFTTVQKMSSMKLADRR